MAFSFARHLTLLERFLDRRVHIVDAIEKQLLNVQGKALSINPERRRLKQIVGGCFFDSTLPADLSSLTGQLSASHRASGFEPVNLEGDTHRFTPVELVIFAYAYWTQHRWPGRNVRVVYAETIFCAFVVDQLAHLSLRLWDDGHEHALERLHQIQGLLERLNEPSPLHVAVRSARWLLQAAQGPLTRQLAPYFELADRICGSFAEGERIDIHRAGALLAGGHLRSQLRYRSRESGRPIDDPDVLSITRNSNSMDAALLVGDLVPLLRGYKLACETNDVHGRLLRADAILQGMSADPELLITRLDVLGPATIIEEVFIQRGDDGRVAYTRAGERYLNALAAYRELVCDLAPLLKDDAQRFDPKQRQYSPLGIVYGFCADILSNIALSTLPSSSRFDLTLEDMFSSGDAADNKLQQSRRWETLPPHRGGRPRFEYSIEWATQMFERLMTALDQRARETNDLNASGLRTSRLLVMDAHEHLPSAGISEASANAIQAQQHCITSDLQRALATGSTAFPKSQISSDRREARYLASVESNGKWFAVSKVLLTTCICQGKDARIADLPSGLVNVLRLSCADLLVVAPH